MVMATPEWKPQIEEKFIWRNRTVLTCVKRVIQPETGKRCLIGRNVTGSGYLDGELLELEECRPYWEPAPGDRVQLAVDWFVPPLVLGTQGECSCCFVDSYGLRLVRVVFDDGQPRVRDFQPIWFLPADASPG
jgi:hypothetical protein